jgi:hypothetical protein
MFTVSWTGATKRCKGRAHHLNLLVTETRFGEHDLLKRHSSIHAFSLQACFFFLFAMEKTTLLSNTSRVHTTVPGLV